jgi:hypothetical protein
MFKWFILWKVSEFDSGPGAKQGIGSFFSRVWGGEGGGGVLAWWNILDHHWYPVRKVWPFGFIP